MAADRQDSGPIRPSYPQEPAGMAQRTREDWAEYPDMVYDAAVRNASGSGGVMHSSGKSRLVCSARKSVTVCTFSQNSISSNKFSIIRSPLFRDISIILCRYENYKT